MENIVNYSLFIVSSILIVVIPGQDFLYVTSRGMALGKRAGVVSAAGISAGLLIHTLLAAMGLSIILQASRVAFLIIQFAGAAYLIFLGVQTLRSKDPMIREEEIQVFKPFDIFIQGLVTNVFNPKALIVFVAFLPQFISINTTEGVAKPLVILGLTLSVIAAIWFSTLGYFAGLVGGWVKRSRHWQNIVRYFSGSILIALGIRLAFQRIK